VVFSGQPGDPAPKNKSYIAASYVKFVESGGARAVPILYDAPPDEVKRIFRAVNGEPASRLKLVQLL
jgi:gamma-glutamyl hydrolase